MTSFARLARTHSWCVALLVCLTEPQAPASARAYVTPTNAVAVGRSLPPGSAEVRPLASSGIDRLRPQPASKKEDCRYSCTACSGTRKDRPTRTAGSSPE